MDDDKEATADDTEPGESGEGEEVARLKSLLAGKDEKIINLSRRVDELGRTSSEKDQEISALKQSVKETEEKLAKTDRKLDEAVNSYRTAVAQANPDIVDELITGDSLDAINSSLEQARNLVSRVKQGLESQISQARVPAGAPERTVPDLSGLSPREKIQYAVSKR